MPTIIRTQEELLATFRLSDDARRSFAQAGIAFIAGDKGGTGKSTCAKAIGEGRKQAGKEQLIVEADKGIQDVAKHFKVGRYCDLNTSRGFRDMYDELINLGKDLPAVVSTPGGLIEKALQHAPQFLDVLPRLPELLQRPVRVAWVIDEKRDALEKLRQFREQTNNKIPIDVVKNEFFAPADEFYLFDGSQERKIILQNGGQILRLPYLDRSVMAKVTNDRISREDAIKALDLFDQAAYERWWAATSEELRGAGYIP